MDMNGKEANGFKKKPSITLESPKAEYQTDDGADYSDSNSLLPPRRGGMSRNSENSEKVPRKVQWNDKKGNKLVEVLEFEPSDAGDSDEEDTDSCFCSIM